MAKRRNLHEDSQDPEEPATVPPAPAAGAEQQPPPPRRARDVPAAAIPPVPLPATEPAAAEPPAASSLPSGFFGSRALFLLLRLGSPAPIKLSFVAAPGVEETTIEAALRSTGVRAERLAPGVYDVDLPSERLEEILVAHHALFRRVEAPGWLHGERVADPAGRAEVTISVEEPLTPDHARELEKLGFHVVAEGPGEVRGVVLGRDLANLVAAPWLGMIEVRKVHAAKKA
jgi:hypothetical protein